MSTDREGWKKILQNAITQVNPDIDVEFGPVYDAVIRPLASILEVIDARVDYIKNIVDINKWPEWTSEDLDQYASNFGRIRRQGTKANGTVVFYAIAKPQANIEIPKDFAVETADGTKFITTDSMTVDIADVENYKNADTGRYEFEVPVESVEYGSANNVASGTIVRLGGSIAGIAGCVNRYAMKGGYDEQTNEELVEDIKLVIQGGLGNLTASAIKLSVFDAFPQVVDIVVERNNPVIDGTIDVYYIGDTISSRQFTTYWYGFDIYLDRGPVDSIVSVTSGLTTFVEDVDFKFIQDKQSAFARTSKAKDRIVWLDGGNKPSYGSQVTVEYRYNSLSAEIEEWQSNAYNTLISDNIIYRRAIPVDIKIDVKVVLYRGYGDSVLSDVKMQIKSFIDNKKIGDSVEVADIISFIKKNVPGVNNITVNTLALVDGDGVEDLVPNKMEYFVIDNNNITVRR